MSCSSSGLGRWSLTPKTRVRPPYTTLFSFPTPSSNGSGCDATNVAMAGSSPPGVTSARVHVGSSRWCPTTIAMTGAREPSFLGRARWSRHGLQSRRDRVRFPGVLLRGLGLADGERGEEAKAELGASPGDHALAAISGSGRRSHKPNGVRFKSARCDEVSRCSEVASRAVRDRETGGSIPLTSTKMPA